MIFVSVHRLIKLPWNLYLDDFLYHLKAWLLPWNNPRYTMASFALLGHRNTTHPILHRNPTMTCLTNKSLISMTNNCHSITQITNYIWFRGTMFTTIGDIGLMMHVQSFLPSMDKLRRGSICMSAWMHHATKDDTDGCMHELMLAREQVGWSCGVHACMHAPNS